MAKAKSKARPKTVLDEAFFPIMGWSPPGWEKEHAGVLLREDILRGMVEAGFTIHQAKINSADQRLKILDLNQKVGLRTLLVDEAFHVLPDYKLTSAKAKRIEKVVKEVKDHPALYGYYLRDEPFYHELSEIYKVQELIRSLDDYHLLYVNHFPIRQMGYGAGSTELFLRNFVREGRPMVLSFDHYCVYSCSDDDLKKRESHEPHFFPEQKVIVRPDFFEGLELFRRFAMDFDIPMWAFCCSQRHGHYPTPTEGHMRFMLMHALAYGARGLQYFTYADSGLVDLQYQPTPAFHIAKKINAEIHAWAPVLRRLTSAGVCHWGPPWHGTFGIWQHGVGSWTDDTLNSFDVEGDPVTIGRFYDDEGLPYFMICNKNPCSVATGLMRITSGENDVYCLDPVRKSAGLLWPYTRGVAFWHLEPGEAQLFRVGGKPGPFV